MECAANERVFSGRIEKLTNAIREEGLDLLIVYSDVWRPGNVGYLTDWRQGGGGISQAWTMLFLSPIKEPTLIVGFELQRQASIFAQGVKRVEPSNRFADILREYASETNAANVGIVGENIMPHALYAQIAGAFGESPRMCDRTDLLTRQRRYKTAQEMEGIKKSFEITDAALLETIKSVRAGISEAELSAIGTSYIHRQGAYLAFYPTVATGTNSAHPMQMSTAKKVERGDLVMIDFGSVYNGFYSDTTRTVSFAVADKMKKSIIETALLAASEGFKLVKPGTKICQIENIVRKVIGEGGFGEYIVHNVGHGIGQDQEEDFPIGPDSEIVLEPGMTFTIEPGIYVPGVGGCRIEEMVAVTQTGGETFCKLKRDWIID